MKYLKKVNILLCSRTNGLQIEEEHYWTFKPERNATLGISKVLQHCRFLYSANVQILVTWNGAELNCIVYI